MSINYDAIRADNERKYGTDIGRIGPMLLANRYDDRTHFIFELLQNAEDAYNRRQNGNIQREVQFELRADVLLITHWGKPFDEPDVRGICGIAESTKDINSIGRFGIGFKSVYAFTNCPEIHSGEEHFAIDSYVWPRVIPPIVLEPDQTILKLPFRPDDTSATEEIINGLKRLGFRSLLFLRKIETISWSAGNLSGIYIRNKPNEISALARDITIIGEYKNQETEEEKWRIFSSGVFTSEGQKAGCVEIAFQLRKKSKDSSNWVIDSM